MGKRTQSSSAHGVSEILRVSPGTGVYWGLCTSARGVDGGRLRMRTEPWARPGEAREEFRHHIMFLRRKADAIPFRVEVYLHNAAQGVQKESTRGLRLFHEPEQETSGD